MKFEHHLNFFYSEHINKTYCEKMASSLEIQVFSLKAQPNVFPNQLPSSSIICQQNQLSPATKTNQIIFLFFFSQLANFSFSKNVYQKENQNKHKRATIDLTQHCIYFVFNIQIQNSVTISLTSQKSLTLHYLLRT